MTDTRAQSATAQAATAQAGFILVTVLWILAALASFVSAFALYLSNTTQAARVRDDALMADTLARGAVELAAAELVNVPKAQRPTHGTLAFRMDEAQVRVVYQDETARIDLNAAPPPLLAGLFTALGARPEAAKTYADYVSAWRAPTGESSAEAERYRDAGLSYGPRGAAFVQVDELWRVAGLPPALVAAALPHVTIFSGRPDVNITDADPVVRAAVTAATEGAANRVEGGDNPLTAFSMAGDTARVTVVMAFDNGQVRTAEAVLLLRDFGADPFRVLSWRDDAQTGEPVAGTVLATRPLTREPQL